MFLVYFWRIVIMEIYIIVEEGLLIDLDIVVVVMIVRFFCKITLFYGV